MNQHRFNLLSISHLHKLVNVVGRGGFEPPKAEPTDLQSAPFDRFGISPIFKILMNEPAEGVEPPTC